MEKILKRSDPISDDDVEGLCFRKVHRHKEGSIVACCARSIEIGMHQADKELAARPCNTGHLPQRNCYVSAIAKHQVGNDGIEIFVWVRKRSGIGVSYSYTRSSHSGGSQVASDSLTNPHFFEEPTSASSDVKDAFLGAIAEQSGHGRL